MYDAHYDLLTILYFNLKKSNPKADKIKLINDCIKIYKDGNVDGGIINLYFMSYEEMMEELGISCDECEDVNGMLEKSLDYLDMMKEDGIIPENKKFLYSIEGCDYIKSIDQLVELHNMGLKVILPVWNSVNKYGSGIRGDLGLTPAGREFIIEAINLGIAIDLSHANDKTFSDIMDVLEELIQKGKDPVFLASHSNVRSICERKRNLTDEQIKRLRNAGGYLGLFSNGNFISYDNENISKEKRKENFINMFSYVINQLGYPKDKILLSTDDMNFNPDESYHGLETFNLSSLKEETQKLLLTRFSESEVNMFMRSNFEGLYNKLNPVKYVELNSNPQDYSDNKIKKL